MLSKKAVQTFRDIYFDVFDEEISDAEAQEMGIRLLELFDAILPHKPTEGGSPN